MLRSHGRTMIPPSRQGRQKGQSLVEFALVFPLFIVLLLSIIEFMFLFNAQLSLNYATRDAALVAAEAGARPDADCGHRPRRPMRPRCTAGRGCWRPSPALSC